MLKNDIKNWALLGSPVSVELFVKLTQQNQNKPELPTGNVVSHKERKLNNPSSVFVFENNAEFVYFRSYFWEKYE